MIQRPLYMEKVKPFIDKDLIKVLVGFRRSGKSMLLNLIQEELIKQGKVKEQFITINFEDFQYFDYREAKKLYQFLLDKINTIEGKAYLFLDEIQEVQGFEQVINSLRVSTNVDIYVTGSNANLLSGELATYLAGRYIQIFVYPFSFREFLRTLPEEKREPYAAFLEYLTLGGMPFVSVEDLPKQACENYLRDIYNSVILKDIIERNKIRNTDLLERTIQFAFQNIGQIFSASSLSKYLKSQQRSVKSDTILNYLSYAKEALLLYPLKRCDLKGKKIFATNEKYYLVDHGLREAMLHSNGADIQQILENVVAIEGIRRGYTAMIGYVNDAEIDFVFEKSGKRKYVQVTYLLSSPETIKREFGSLLKIQDGYRKIVVSMDPILQPRDGIEHKRIEDFLLEDEW